VFVAGFQLCSMREIPAPRGGTTTPLAGAKISSPQIFPGERLE
jgi:hypothetical protein